METITGLGDQWIRNILDIIEIKYKKSKKGVFWMYLMIIRIIIENYFKVLDLFHSEGSYSKNLLSQSKFW